VDIKVGSLYTDGKLCRVVSVEPPDDKHPVGLVVIVGAWKASSPRRGPSRRIGASTATASPGSSRWFRRAK
jgi:hypothetical protein